MHRICPFVDTQNSKIHTNTAINTAELKVRRRRRRKPRPKDTKPPQHEQKTEETSPSLPPPPPPRTRLKRAAQRKRNRNQTANNKHEQSDNASDYKTNDEAVPCMTSICFCKTLIAPTMIKLMVKPSKHCWIIGPPIIVPSSGDAIRC